jgi:hypothetical protein
VYTCSMDQMSEHASRENKSDATDLSYNHWNLWTTMQNLVILKRVSARSPPTVDNLQRTYPRGQIDGKFQVAKTTQAGANLVSALSRAQALKRSSVTEKIKGKQVCWE